MKITEDDDEHRVYPSRREAGGSLRTLQQNVYLVSVRRADYLCEYIFTIYLTFYSFTQ